MRDNLVVKKEVQISFVIPAYNEEKYLRDCLDSVISDIRLSNILFAEIIVVNNASTDSTKKVALSYPEIKVIDENKKGLVLARAAGAKASLGELLAHIDADCRIPKGWTNLVLNEFKANKNLVALSGPYVYYDLAPWKNFVVKLYYFFGNLLSLTNRLIFNTGEILQGGNFVVKKSAWEKIGPAAGEFDFYGEDTDLARRLGKIGRVKFSLKLKNFTSARRFLKEGLIETGKKYALNYLWVTFLKKPFTKKYTDVRPI